MNETFICGVCGQTHGGLPMDYGFRLPDEVWAIPEPERSERAQFDADRCRLEHRYFIRCVLPIPVIDSGESFRWGVWIEVEWPVFERYLSVGDADGSAEPPYTARLANIPPAYADTLGTPAVIQFGGIKQRPFVHFPADASSTLALEQRHGIDLRRYHEILSSLGFTES